MGVIGGGIVNGTNNIQSQEITFTETGGALTYTGSVTIPGGSFLVDVIVHGVALWDNSGTASMKVGDAANDDGIFVDIDLKATDLLAGETISAAGGTGTSAGVEGADIVATQWNRRYLATERVISGIITTSSTGGSAGRTRMVVIWAQPGGATAATSA